MSMFYAAKNVEEKRLYIISLKAERDRLKAELADVTDVISELKRDHKRLENESDAWKAKAERLAEALKEIYLVIDGLSDSGWEPDLKRIREALADYEKKEP